MNEVQGTRSARLADQYEAAQQGFVRLVESLSDEQWRRQGTNTPGSRVNEEDEARPVGVIAHHVALSGEFIIKRIDLILHDQPTPPVDFKVTNAEHAAKHADATREEVLTRLRTSGRHIADAVRAIPDEKLDIERQFPMGTMSVQQRIERVLIGHIQSHQASIEATVS